MRPHHLALAVLTTALWGFAFVAIRWGLDELPPLLFTALRFAVLVPLLPLVGRTLPARPLEILGVGLFLGTVQFALLFSGMKLGLPAGLASLVIQSQAFFTVLFAALMLGEWPRLRQLAGMAVAFAGMGAIAAGLAGGGSRLGLLLCIGAAVSWACANLVMRRAKSTRPAALMVWMALVPPVPLLLGSWLFEGPGGFQALAELSARGWFAILYNGFVASLAGFGLWSLLLARYSAVLVAPFSLLVPIFGMGFAALLLGEMLTPLKYAAGALVLLGLALVVLPERKPVPVVTGATTGA